MAVAGFHKVSSHLGEMERERVRQVFRQWKNFAAKERPEGWLGESDQQENKRGSSAAEIVDRFEQNLTENNKKSFRRLSGRKFLLDLLKKTEIEKQQELYLLSEHQAVSKFSHRSLIQELIRDRSLRNGRNITEDERQLCLLRQTGRTSDLRKGSVSSSDASSNGDIDGNGREQDQANNSEHDVNEFHPETETNIEENDNHELSDGRTDTGSSIVELNGLSSHYETTSDDDLHNEINGDDRLQHDETNPVLGMLDDLSDREAYPVGRMDPFYVPDGDNPSRREISELLSRKSVSTLLGSDFRECLDQLMRSYLERQIQSLQDSDLEGTSPIPEHELEQQSQDQNSHSPIPEHELEPQNQDQNSHQEDSAQNPAPDLPSPSISSVEQILDQESEHLEDNDKHQRFGTELEMINELRIDMVKLQRRMIDMQRMLEACMEMQLELQRSIKQEVSAALNRSACPPCSCENGLPENRSKLENVRKGICCICCHTNIDSLLYRCGHMCTCLKCANDLVRNVEKCPMCHAPVIEVIRAYSIL